MSVLITEGTYKNSLAILRALSEKNITVYVVSNSKKAVCSYSKFCKKAFVSPNPHTTPEKYIRTLIAILKKYKIDVLMPVGVSSFALASQHMKELEKYAIIPVQEYKYFSKAHDKFTASKIAEKIDIPVPATFTPKSKNELKQCIKKLGLPVVIKARKGTGIYDYAYSEREAISIWNRYEQKSKEKKGTGITDYSFPVVQEYLPGEIVDVLVIFNKGKLRGCLTQKRYLTSPPSGGVGALNITTKDEEAAKYGVKLMKELKWHGVAMVEFKRDKDGIPKLIEINPKFWGTTEVSISAEMNFPYMLYKIATEGDVKPNFRYLFPKHFGWPIEMGIEHILTTDKKLFAFREYLKLFAFKNSNDIRLWQDPKPFAFQIYKIITKYYSKFLKSLKNLLRR